jgi:hypothetical protein
VPERGRAVPDPAINGACGLLFSAANAPTPMQRAPKTSQSLFIISNLPAQVEISIMITGTGAPPVESQRKRPGSSVIQQRMQNFVVGFRGVHG